MSTKVWTGGASDLNWATAGNWSPSGVPANGDDVIFDSTAATGVNGSDQSAVTLNTLTIFGTFGLSSPSTILFGSNGTPLKVGVTTGKAVLINAPTQGKSNTQVGCQRINLDLAATGPVVTVFTSNTTPIDTGKEVVRIKTASSSCNIDILGGSGGVGIATDNYSDTATVNNINVTGGTVNLGAGVTYANLVNDGGQVLVRSAPGTGITAVSGDIYTRGTYVIPAATFDGGTIHCLHRPASGAAITTATFQSGGTLDLSQSGEAFTITNLTGRIGTINVVTAAQLTLTNGTAPDFNNGTKWSFST